MCSVWLKLLGRLSQEDSWLKSMRKLSTPETSLIHYLPSLYPTSVIFHRVVDDLSPEDITFTVAGEIQPLIQQLEDLKRLLTLSVLLSHILAYDITGC